MRLGPINRFRPSFHSDECVELYLRFCATVKPSESVNQLIVVLVIVAFLALILAMLLIQI